MQLQALCSLETLNKLHTVEPTVNLTKAYTQWRIDHWANWAMAPPPLKIYFSFFTVLRSHGLYIFELFDSLTWQRESGRNHIH